MQLLLTQLRADYASRYRSVVIDRASFHARYRVCQRDAAGRMQCEGICCYDGVTLHGDELNVIRQLLEQERSFFQQQQINFDQDFIEPDQFWGGEIKIASRPYHYSSGVQPAHFNATRCWFSHLETATCSLQNLAIRDGLHPWRYKPLECWIHPICLGTPQQLRIAIPNEMTDLFIRRGAGYTHYTPCGRACDDGTVGYKLFAAELALLSQVLDRDLLSEIQQECVQVK